MCNIYGIQQTIGVSEGPDDCTNAQTDMDFAFLITRLSYASIYKL